MTTTKRWSSFVTHFVSRLTWCVRCHDFVPLMNGI